MTMTFKCMRSAFRWYWFWVALPFMAALGIFVGVYVITPMVFGPPVILMDVHLLKGDVHAGGKLRFYIKERPVQGLDCPGYIVREWQRRVEIDGKVVWEKDRRGMIPPPIVDLEIDLNPDGTASYVIVTPVPSDLEPGQWRFRGRTVRTCGFLNLSTNYDTPPLYFTILAKE